MPSFEIFRLVCLEVSARKQKHRRNPLVRKAALVFMETDAQLLSEFPATLENSGQFPGSIICESLPIN
jgi:hypothetical protein